MFVFHPGGSRQIHRLPNFLNFRLFFLGQFGHRCCADWPSRICRALAAPVCLLRVRGNPRLDSLAGRGACFSPAASAYHGLRRGPSIPDKSSSVYTFPLAAGGFFLSCFARGLRERIFFLGAGGSRVSGPEPGRGVFRFSSGIAVMTRKRGWRRKEDLREGPRAARPWAEREVREFPGEHSPALRRPLFERQHRGKGPTKSDSSIWL